MSSATCRDMLATFPAKAFPLALLSSALVGVLLALVERIGMNKTVWDSGLLDSEMLGVCPYQKGSSSVLIYVST